MTSDSRQTFQQNAHEISLKKKIVQRKLLERSSKH